jgi:hypothetical protein
MCPIVSARYCDGVDRGDGIDLSIALMCDLLLTLSIINFQRLLTNPPESIQGTGFA